MTNHNKTYEQTKRLYLSERRSLNGTHQSHQRHRHHQRHFGRLSEIQQELPVDLLLVEYGSAHIGHAERQNRRQERVKNLA